MAKWLETLEKKNYRHLPTTYYPATLSLFHTYVFIVYISTPSSVSISFAFTIFSSFLYFSLLSGVVVVPFFFLRLRHLLPPAVYNKHFITQLFISFIHILLLSSSFLFFLFIFSSSTSLFSLYSHHTRRNVLNIKRKRYFVINFTVFSVNICS